MNDTLREFNEWFANRNKNRKDPIYDSNREDSKRAYKAGHDSRDEEVRDWQEQVGYIKGDVINIKEENKRLYKNRDIQSDALTEQLKYRKEDQEKIERLEAENKKLIQIAKNISVNKEYWEHCPDCDDVGYYSAGQYYEPEQMQCEFCYTNSRSVFNQNRIKQALKE